MRPTVSSGISCVHVSYYRRFAVHTESRYACSPGLIQFLPALPTGHVDTLSPMVSSLIVSLATATLLAATWTLRSTFYCSSELVVLSAT